MKSRASRCNRSSTTTFLKPGALAQIRYSKMVAKSREKYTRALMDLTRMDPVSEVIVDGGDDDVIRNVGLEEIPCFMPNFKNRYQLPRSIVRKKLVAIMPILTES
ncbi:hypothetical protein LIER_22210 [Lithospermum erythrorhizon]|uniref:Uncharacterized protein n=1 Tax=Lithospermum erythrorhizon TaxID=34254 RepID=A0AAV3QW12_LITER